MKIDDFGGEIPPLELIYESDRLYFEENPDARCGIRLPHPEEGARNPGNYPRQDVCSCYTAGAEYPRQAARGQVALDGLAGRAK